MPLRGLVLLIYFIGSLPVCFFQPFYGIVLWTVVAFLNPQSFTWGAAEAFPWALAVAIPTLSGYLLFGHGLATVLSRKLTILGVLWGWFTITSIASSQSSLFNHHASLTWERWVFVSKILLMVVFTVAIVDSFKRLRILVLTIAGCFGFFVAKSLPFLVLSGGAYRLYGPERSMIADNNDFGLALNMTLPLFFFLAQAEVRPWLKWLFGALFLGTIPAIFFTYSRGAMVGLAAVLLLMFLQLRQRFVLIPVIALGAAIAVLFAPEGWKQRMDPTSDSVVDKSAQARLNAWAFSWNLAMESPVTGGGFATFTPELFQRYAPNAKDIHGPHSVYFQILAEHGFVGLALYLSLLAQSLLNAYRLVREARVYGDRDVILYANMFRFSLVGFATSGVFLGRAYFDYTFTIIACLVILDIVVRREWSAEMVEEEAEQNDSEELAGNELLVLEQA
jgi:putative inorganic carbon (hco3(-)) transporter